MVTAILAFFIDTVVGDPGGKWHPVALIGRLIAFLERIFYRKEQSRNFQFLSGAIVVLLTICLCYDLTAALMHAVSFLPLSYADTIVGAIVLSFTICPKSLAKAGRDIYTLLAAGDLVKAREAVGRIVGRDTRNLDDGEMARATVETVAENTNDGIIAPLFYFVIGGVPLAVMYRAVNTLDSMLGYHNARYEYFGKAAARLDDVFGYIPARITGMLFVLSALLLGLDAHRALDTMRRDAAKHPSPNGGCCEAPMAGALHIRLGGYNTYFGKKEFRAYMGEVLELVAPKHILASIRMMYTAVILFLLLAYFLLVVMGYA